MENLFFNYFENKDKVGVQLYETDLYNESGQTVPTIYYIKGVPEFDIFLGGNQFYEIGYYVTVISFSNAMVFLLSAEGKEAFAYGVWRTQISKIEYLENQTITVIDPSHSINALKAGAMGRGLIPHLAGKVMGTISEKIRGLKTKTEAGTSFKLFFLNSIGKEHLIELNVPKKFNLISIALITFWKNTLSAQESKPIDQSRYCYVATACYKNFNSPELIIFRKYRDETLVKYSFGRLFIKIYYLSGPFFFKFLAKNEKINTWVRLSILDKIYLKLERKQKEQF